MLISAICVATFVHIELVVVSFVDIAAIVAGDDGNGSGGGGRASQVICEAITFSQQTHSYAFHICVMLAFLWNLLNFSNSIVCLLRVYLCCVFEIVQY